MTADPTADPSADGADTDPPAVSLSVVLPVYNEAAGVATVIDEILTHILDRVPGSELVVVDDHSTDDSVSILRRYSRNDPRIRLIVNAENEGHGPSVRRAIDASVGAWIFHLDSDGQVDVAEFEQLWPRRCDHDLVLGTRRKRHDPRHRLVLTWVTRIFVSVLARRRVPDANVPFKLVRRELFEHLRPFTPASSFAPSILLVLGALRSGARVCEIDTTHLARRHGRSTLDVRRLGRAVARCTRETMLFARRPIPPFRPS